MENEIFTLTPKRKSILWNYQDNDTATIIVVKSEALKNLELLFRHADGGDAKIKSEDGLAVSLNLTGTRIWENCDGITTVSEIVDILSSEFEVSKEEVLHDIKDFFEYCIKLDIIDLNWRSLI